jgi:hypothetical protein
MQAAVNDTNLIWTIATWHRPPYSYGERSGWDEGKDNWSPVLVTYEADWMVGGHSHNYQRMVPIRGVRYLVAGGGGGRLYWSATNHPTHAFATTCYHHVSVHVTNDVMQLRGMRSDGLVFDSVVVTNRRQVRVEPAFPQRGQTAKIFYRATEGPLAGANPVRIHIGQDAFASAFADEPMTWNAARQRWEYEFTVPASATQRLAFVFHDGAGTWHNNYSNNWQALLARASVSPEPPAAGSNVTIRYEADMGPLAGTTRVDAWISFERRPVPGDRRGGAGQHQRRAVGMHGAGARPCAKPDVRFFGKQQWLGRRLAAQVDVPGGGGGGLRLAAGASGWRGLAGDHRTTRRASRRTMSATTSTWR